MALIETLTTGLCTSIATHLFKSWLKDSPLMSEIASSTTNALSKQYTDFRAKRATNRGIEQVAERSAESIHKILENEFKNEKNLVDDVTLQKICNAASETIRNFDFSIGVLTDHNFDPCKLAKSLLNLTGKQGGNPFFANHEDVNVRQVYERIIEISVQQIIDIAPQLPKFTERVLVEMLDNQFRVLDLVQRVLDGIDRVNSSMDLTQASSQFESKFRLATMRRYDQLELFGIDLNASNKRYKLSVAYVTLNIERIRKNAINRDASRLGSSPRESINVQEALVTSTRLLIRGQAGSGKTTFINWVAVTSAGRAHSKSLEQLNECVPFIIKLRDFPDALPKPEDFTKLVGSALTGKPENWVESLLTQGNAIILVDGLDETSDANRVQTKHWLEDLIAQFPKARYIVTTRPYAVEEGWLDADGFVDATLQEMTASDIKTFIEHWHAAVASSIESETEIEEILSLPKELRAKINHHPSISKLASSPLLCAILCALHRERFRNLPEDRISLYQACIDMFFRRDTERKIPNSDYVRLDDRQKHLLLQAFAWWLIRNEMSSATPIETSNRLGTLVKELKIDDDITGHQLTRLFVERVGILRQFAVGKIDFPHRTFQEYLAAHEAIAEDDLKMLIKNAHLDHWREVVILAAGLIGNKNKASEFVKDLLDEGDKDDEGRQHQLRIFMVAGAALEMIPRLPDDCNVRKLTLDRVATIVPPTSLDDASSLAKVGDLVVNKLEYQPSWSSECRIISARTLSLINSAASAEMLGTYFGETDTKVFESICSSLHYLSPENLSRAIESAASRCCIKNLRLNELEHLFNANCFRNFSGIESLDLSRSPNLRNIDGLQKFRDIRKLLLSECPNLTSLEAITYLHSLEELNISNCNNIERLLGLEKCVLLNDIDLSGCRSLVEVGDSFFSPSLNRLNMSGCTSFRFADSGRKNRSLKKLILSNCRTISDLVFLSAFPDIESLVLHSCKNLISLDGISELTSLKYLDLSSCTNLTNTNALRGNQKLERLFLNSCSAVEHLDSLEGNRSLKYLSISGSGLATKYLQKVLPNTEIDTDSDNWLNYISK